MRAFAEAWPDLEIVQRVVGQLPWGQNIELLGLKDPAARLWYAETALAQGWSRPVLAVQIDTGLRERKGKAITNFERALPPETSDLAQQVLKDPYQFDFLTLSAAAQERDVERALIARVKDLLLELGKVSPSSAASIALRSAVRSSTSTCSSITGARAAWSRSISRWDRSSRSTPAR